MKSLAKKAHAKLNLGLEVLNKRDDGFHNINTVFVRVGLFDDLLVEESKVTQIEWNSPVEVPLEDNLVFKALLALRKYSGLENLNAKITINKRIPQGGGLGGGSSDAAAALIAFNEFFELGVHTDELFELASEIGSDVPFFIGDGAASAKGRGEILNYFNYEITDWLVIVYPKIHVSTPEAYKSLQRSTDFRKSSDFKSILYNSSKYEWKSLLINDFEETVFEKHSDLKIIKNNLYNLGAYFALMSGSGSCIFGMFENEVEAKNAANSLKEYECFVCSPGTLE